jgi:hypothetical protein
VPDRYDQPDQHADRQHVPPADGHDLPSPQHGDIVGRLGDSGRLAGGAKRRLTRGRRAQVIPPGRRNDRPVRRVGALSPEQGAVGVDRRLAAEVGV